MKKSLFLFIGFALPAIANTVYFPGLWQSQFKQPSQYGFVEAKTDTIPVLASNLVSVTPPAYLDRTPGIFMGYSAGNGPSPRVNPVSGRSWGWYGYDVYAYEGEMFVEEGKTYQFYGRFDDGEALVIDGKLVVHQGTTSGFNGEPAFTASYTATMTGWVPFNAWIWDWVGGKDVIKCLYALQYNPSGTPSTSYKDATVWREIIDPGDMSLLRVAGTNSFTSISSVSLAENGSDYELSVSFEDLPSAATAYACLGAHDGGTSSTSAWDRVVALGSLESGSSLTNFVIPNAVGATTMRLYVVGEIGVATFFTEWTQAETFTIDPVVLLESIDFSAAGSIATIALRRLGIGVSEDSLSLEVSTSEDGFDNPAFTFAYAGNPATAVGTFSIVATGLTTNTPYWFRAKAVNELGGEGVSEIVSHTIVPMAPEGLYEFTGSSTTSLYATATVSTPGNDAATVLVRLEAYQDAARRRRVAVSEEIMALAGQNVMLAVNGLEDDTEYYLSVRLANDWGLESFIDDFSAHRTERAPKTFYVSAETGSDENNGLSWDTATASIQKAIDISFPGDAIVVTNGVYSSITFSNRRIMSVAGPEVTIIDGKGSGRCVSGLNRENAIISGFTICNGSQSARMNQYATQGPVIDERESKAGAGVRLATVSNCIISNNTSSIGSANYIIYASLGGGAYQCNLKDCLIVGNKAGLGAGCNECSATSCVFERNCPNTVNSSMPGYGICSANSSLTNCIVRLNNNGSSLFSGDTLVNCLVVNNQLTSSDPIQATFYNSTIASNFYKDARNVTGESGISGSPFNCIYTQANSTNGFVACIQAGIDDFQDGFHLAPTSRAIDAGANEYINQSVDLDGNPRISRRRVDAGCYEYPIPMDPEFLADGGFRFTLGEKAFSITSDNTNGVLFYAINDGDFVSANAQSIDLTTTETIHVRAYVLAYDRFQSEIVEADIVKVEPCAVVEGATATWNEAETEVAVEWTVQPEAFTYAVYRGEDDDFANATQLTNHLESCRYVDEPGDSDLVYYYWVVGENELGPGQVGEAVATRWAQVATPTISPEDGTRFGTASKKVMFTCSTAGVKFHYTIDGSEPTTNSPTASAFTLKDTATVKVVAVKNRMRNSEVASATITRVRVAPSPALGPAVQAGAGLSIAWGAVDEAESYEVFRGRSPDFAAAQSLGGTEETEWTDATAEAGVPYYYFVVSKNIAGTSDAGEPALGATLTLATAVNAPQLVFATGADCPWTAIVTNGAADGTHQATSGTPVDSAESWLETSVTGPGRITFQWKASCEKDDTGECEWDHLAFRVDGEDFARLDGQTRWAEVSLPITGGDHILRWVYAKDEGMSAGEDCGALDCVQWIPDETKGDWEKWVDCYGLLTESGYEALKQKPSGKGDTLYEEFVAGLNPLDPLSRFRARINASVEPPSISWNPDLGDARLYTVEGKNMLTDETWNAPNNDSRFFRVWVTKEEE